MNAVDMFSGTVSRDLFHLVCDKQLGEGCYREVFVNRFDPATVVKFEIGSGDFSNIAEWQVWESVAGTELAKWFAPCKWISPNGSILIQRRTKPARMSDLPDKIPAFFTDNKVDNWGLLNGKPVCHDYGLHNMLEKGATKRLVNARWADDD